MTEKNRLAGTLIGLLLLLLSLLIWYFPSDVVELVVRQREVVLGRYSRGHFGSLFVLTLLLWISAGFAFSQLRGRELFFSALMLVFSVFGSILALVVLSGMLFLPRYVEMAAMTAGGDEAAEELQGIVRHRPPNEFFEFTYTDAPENHRSYPENPPGYGSVDITLTTDAYGFRNREVSETYPILAVGDSFTAGSHVSDEQVWTELLASELNSPIYNLGVSGSDPRTYYNNFAVFGSRFQPQTVLFVVYEGNDFRYSAPRVFDPSSGEEHVPLGEKLRFWMKGSPVTTGLRRFSSEVLEKIGSDKPVPGYQQQMGWMPVRIASGDKVTFYSFKPKRLFYLMRDEQEFLASGDWQGAREAFLDMKALSDTNGFRLIMVYVPSKPHVVMPLIEESVDAEQLRTFVSYRFDEDKRHLLPEAETFKQQLFSQINNQEKVFMAFCREEGLECISTTHTLQQASASGVQTYYTYDQHWTPAGNALVARLIADYLQQTPAAKGE